MLFRGGVFAQTALSVVWAPVAKSSNGLLKPFLTTNNYLVSHSEVRQRTSAGYFIPKTSVSVIPDDNYCITVQEAKTWLYLDESVLPVNGRLPVWQELVPGHPACPYPQKWVGNGCESPVITCQSSVFRNGFYDNVYRYSWSDGSLELISLSEDLPCAGSGGH